MGGVKSVFAENLRTITRYSYSDESLSIDHLRNLASVNQHTDLVQRIEESIVEQESSYPNLEALDSAADFVQRGIGFCLLENREAIGAAYSSLVSSHAIEVSIIVNPDYHRQGIATVLTCQLLLWCLEHRVSPHWDAANPESCKLAEKLGYRKTGEYTAYFLS